MARFKQPPARSGDRYPGEAILADGKQRVVDHLTQPGIVSEDARTGIIPKAAIR
jgi:hypothetical protein